MEEENKVVTAMKQYDVQVRDETETQALAERLSHHLQAGDVLAMEGDIGAGKTSFTKGLARGLGIKRNVNSPTFTIIKEYAGKLPLYHMDVYRLEGSDEDLGFDEYFYGDGITVIEWAGYIEDQLPRDRLTIVFTVTGPSSRQLRFIPSGTRYEQLCEEFFNEDLGD